MKDLMKAPLEGSVDTDPEFLQGFVDKFHDIVFERMIENTRKGGADGDAIEGELVDKGVEVKVYEDRIPLNDFLTQTLELRRERKKEIVANHNALEGEFEQGPPADMRKFFLPNGGIDVFALSTKAQRLAPKPAIEGELLPPPRQSPVRNIGEREISDLGLEIEIQRQLDAKTLDGEFIRNPMADYPESQMFVGTGIPMLSEACIDSGDSIAELPAIYTDANGKRTIIQPAIEGEFIGNGERHISHIVEWEFLCEPGIAITERRGGETCQANPENKQISCEQPLTTKNLLIK